MKRTERNLISHGDGNATNKCSSSDHVVDAHVTLASSKPKCNLLYVIKGNNTSNRDGVSKEKRDADNGANGEKKGGGTNTEKNGDQSMTIMTTELPLKGQRRSVLRAIAMTIVISLPFRTSCGQSSRENLLTQVLACYPEANAK
ncbi:hypothetical protein VFPPC_18393 [Pochonia chlamydosporia 170]|uniref:Uncharacterized protein n=1 Tax=Pochonia chlamydosporia 170 TaxID=1380566 RepID=A0A219APK5_METCM|nr:hypothetical protein VFPPC_18393 [Pochonia chlamydosporia 170]OWT42492.1 hypothetical protein VFPPC_18393 [Pochonia chlamydosporia 170]